MKKDIKFPKVEDIAVAIVKEKNEHGEEAWISYLLNLKEEEIGAVLVSTQGYGMKDNIKVKTSALRHFLDTLQPASFAKIEVLTPELLEIGNQFWVSFYSQNVMFDKKYVFVAGSIHEANLINVPLLDKKGVMIQ